MSRASLGFVGFGSWTEQASNFLLLIGHLWMPEESVDLEYSFEWLAESALQIMMVLQETDLPPPALLGLQLSHYMDWFSSGHRRVLMHENYVQTNHAKDKTQSYVFFCSPSWPVKTTGHSWLRNNKPRDRIKWYLSSVWVRALVPIQGFDWYKLPGYFPIFCCMWCWQLICGSWEALTFAFFNVVFIVLFWLTYKPHKHKNKRQPKKTRKRKRPIEPECQSVTVVFVCLVSVLCCLLFTWVYIYMYIYLYRYNYINTHVHVQNKARWFSPVLNLKVQWSNPLSHDMFDMFGVCFALE